jgi:amino acid transporter
MPLRRTLGFLGTAALPIGGMAPTLAMSVTGVQVVHLPGRAAPLAYLLAGAAVLLIGLGFARLSTAFSHAGSVYAFVGKTPGPGAGFVATLMLLGNYILFPPVSVLGMAAFTQAFLRHTGIVTGADWLPIALISWALVWRLVWRGISLTARSVIAVEAVSLLLITALIVVIFVRLGTGNAPGHQTLTPDVFKLPRGTGLAAVGFACTYSILSFGGFESSISAGEESCRPAEAIPRSVVAAVLFGTVFYAFCVSGQVLGFGAGPAGVARFARFDGAPRGSRAHLCQACDGRRVRRRRRAQRAGSGARWSGRRVADAIRAGSRPDPGERPGDRLAPDRDPGRRDDGQHDADVRAAAVVRTGGTGALDAFFYLATTGALSLLMVYVLVSVSALRLHVLSRDKRRLPAAVLPLGGAVAALYVLYRNLIPAPAFPYSLFSYLVGGWLVLGLTVAAAMPQPRRRVSEGLARS